MKARKPTAPDRKQLIAAIRAAAAKTGQGKVLTFTQFLTISKFRPQYIFRHFSKWNHALRAAGFAFERFNAPVSNARLLEDWARCARKHRRIPTHLEYNLGASHSTTTFIKRFGAWSKVPAAFRAFATKSANRARKWRDVLAFIPASRQNCHPERSAAQSKDLTVLPPHASQTSHGRIQPAQTISSPHPRRGGRIPGRPVCGPPIDFEGLRHAPANEAGVVFLFGRIARRLGFLVEAVQTGFPDCEAKRLVGPDEWQTVRIEFEFLSRNFMLHAHDPERCDLIVCWEHNWPECPPNLEVIALKEHIARLAPKNGCAGKPA